MNAAIPLLPAAFFPKTAENPIAKNAGIVIRLRLYATVPTTEPDDEIYATTYAPANTTDDTAKIMTVTIVG